MPSFQNSSNDSRPGTWHELRSAITRTSSWSRKKVAAFLEPFGITQQQYQILFILRQKHPQALSNVQIRQQMVDQTPDISRLVERLQSKSLLKKKPSTDNGRLVELRLTDEGIELMQDIDRQQYRLDKMFGNITEKEAKEVNRLLDQMCAPPSAQ